MSWVSLCAFRHRYDPFLPESARSLKSLLEIARGLLHCATRRDEAQPQAWHAASGPARGVFRDWLNRERRNGHALEAVSCLAMLQVADLALGQSPGALPGLSDFRPDGPAAQRALALLREHEAPSAKLTKKGHIYSLSSLEKALAVADIDRLAKMVTTWDHPWSSAMRPWVQIVAINRGLAFEGEARTTAARQFLETWGLAADRTIVFERQSPAPGPGTEDPEDTDGPTFEDAEVRGFDAVELQGDDVICYHYIDTRWQTGDTSWHPPRMAFWSLGESELALAWSEAMAVIGEEAQAAVDAARAPGVCGTSWSTTRSGPRNTAMLVLMRPSTAASALRPSI